ncbi:hypothetical protein B9Z19DRAFT_1163088 [Tuber borchii]|uniref:Uncharacterized protein n=1 Tax=Tuber borchii TaxID=42251 RepID=A0A2T6ZD49_TUBBO|nr:hypothetical protein B9Z19DRAFT_1163088 [Tuber borchii]
MERPDISEFVHPTLSNQCALGTRMVVLQAKNQKGVYVHKALIKDEAGGCTWSCFPSTTVRSFVEYLYQGDYNPPPITSTYLGGWDKSVEDFSDDYKEIFLTHAQLFILSRYRNELSLANLCLERLEEAIVEAQSDSVESLFVRNMRTLIEYSYSPHCYGLGDGVWEELQKAVCRFLVSQKGWLLEKPGSGLVGEDSQLTKDLLTMFINLSIDTDKLRMEAERKCEALKTELAQSKSAKKKKRQALTTSISVKKCEELNAYRMVL